MNRVRAAGGLLVVLALIGYLVGVVAPYPGRSFTLTGLMVGIAIVAMSRSRPESSGGDGR